MMGGDKFVSIEPLTNFKSISNYLVTPRYNNTVHVDFLKEKIFCIVWKDLSNKALTVPIPLYISSIVFSIE